MEVDGATVAMGVRENEEGGGWLMGNAIAKPNNMRLSPKRKTTAEFMICLSNISTSHYAIKLIHINEVHQ